MLNKEMVDIFKTYPNVKTNQTLFRNSKYKRLIYSFTHIQFTVPKEDKQRIIIPQPYEQLQKTVKN